MQDLLQFIDLDYYRSTRLLIARAELAQLRQQPSAIACVEQQSKTPLGTSRSGNDLNQLLMRLQLFDSVLQK